LRGLEGFAPRGSFGDDAFAYGYREIGDIAPE
jgi:hypothetical protein